MGTECSAFRRVVFLIYRPSAVPVGLCPVFTRQVTCSRKLVLPVVPRLKFARAVLPTSSLRWQQPGRSVPPFPGASVHQGSRWPLVFSSGVRDVCRVQSLLVSQACLPLSRFSSPSHGIWVQRTVYLVCPFRFRRCLSAVTLNDSWTFWIL